MFLLKPLKFLAKALAAEDSAEKLAAGFALGLAVGLIPKSSLLAHLGLIVICLFQVNLAAGYCAVAVFSLLSPLLDPLTHAIGALLLIKAGFLAPLWTFLYNVPLIPWTEFNNTVVLGSVVLGGAAAFPIYKLTIPFFAKYRDTIGKKIRSFKIVQLLLGADLGSKLGTGA